MRALVLATQNAKKRKELEALTEGTFRVLTLDDVGLSDLDIVEDADTFQGNARIKAEAVLAALGARGALGDVAAVLADDSGLCVDALGGAPGVRSARFAKDHDAGEGDEANNALLLARLGDVADEQRAARFVCAICVKLPDGRVLEAEGAVEGKIARDERGAGGFGYDPLFCPEEAPGKRMAELSPEEKHAISHRGRATREALGKLREVVG